MNIEILKSEFDYRDVLIKTVSTEKEIVESIKANGSKGFLDRQNRLLDFLAILQKELEQEIEGLGHKKKKAA